MKKILIILFLANSFVYSQYSEVTNGFLPSSGLSSSGIYSNYSVIAEPLVGNQSSGIISNRNGFLYGLDFFILPTTQASNLMFTNISRTGMTVKWTSGNGDARILLGRERYAIPNNPLTDGVTYTNHSGSYTDAQNSTVSNSKVLYKGTSNSVGVTDLTRYKLYYYRIIEYNGGAGSELYLQDDATGNPRSRWTLRRDGLMEEDLSIDAEYAYPNPASKTISTTLDVFEAGQITATLYDMSGKSSIELYNQSHSFGTYDLTFDISKIPSGVYQLVISKGNEAIVYPVEVVR